MDLSALLTELAADRAAVAVGTADGDRLVGELEPWAATWCASPNRPGRAPAWWSRSPAVTEVLVTRS